MDWKQFEIAPKKLRTTNITSFAERQARKLEKINQKIMTLEEAIEHCEKVADSTEFAKVTYFDDNGVVLGSGDEADFVYYSELLSKGYKLVDGDIREYPGLDSKGNLKCLI